MVDVERSVNVLMARCEEAEALGWCREETIRLQEQEIANMHELTAKLESDVAHEKELPQWGIEEMLTDMERNKQLQELENRRKSTEEMMRQIGELKAQVERLNHMNHHLNNQLEDEKVTVQRLMIQISQFAVDLAHMKPVVECHNRMRERQK
jgi:hypothetical protein